MITQLTYLRSLQSLGLLLSFSVVGSSLAVAQPHQIEVPQQVIIAPQGQPPSNVTLTPASATNLQIGWTASPGAVRYLISRNDGPDIAIDANAGFADGNRFTYADVGRRPSTLYKYSVTAVFSGLTAPSRSAPVQI